LAAPKGHPRYGGRTKGTPNKVTTAFKAAVLVAFDSIGGEKQFAAWAEKNQTEFYKIASRLIPHEVVGPGGGEHRMVFRWQPST